MIKKIRIHAIIHAASVAAAAVGGGLAQIPTSDTLIITPIQLAMITGIGRTLGIKLTESTAAATLASATAATIGRAGSQLMIGWWPIAGNAINAVTAAGLTEAIGWAAYKEFLYDSEEAA